MIDTKSEEINTKKTIVVQENKIIDVKDGYIMSKSGILIDKVIMPSLIDFHAHIEQYFITNTRLNGYILNEADVAYNSVNL